MHSIQCTNCEYVFKFRDEHVGRKAKCRECGESTLLRVSPPEPEPPLLADFPEVKELVPILCEHCSAPYQVHNAMGLMVRCDRCEKMTCVALLDTSKLPGPNGPGANGCVPGFRGDPEHYKAAFEAGSRNKARRRQLVEEGVLSGLLFHKMLLNHFFVKGDFPGGLKLAGANLQGALFFFAGDAFESADLRGANFEGATWISTSLAGARCDGANLRGCLIGGNFGLIRLGGTSFRGADLSVATVALDTYAEEGDQEVYFTGANLEGARLVTEVHLGKVDFKNARMKACKVSENLLPLMSKRQRAEVEVIIPDGVLTAEEKAMAAHCDRRFRSVPVLVEKSQTHSYGENVGSTTVTQTTYNLSDAREHVLKGHFRRHLCHWLWPVGGLGGAALGFAAAAVACGAFQWPPAWWYVLPPLAGLFGAYGNWDLVSQNRWLYRQQAWADRGWKAGEKRPELRIVFEHEWREFSGELR